MKRVLQFTFLFIFFGGITSCAENVDFNQFDDLEAIPSYESSIFYLESPEFVINQVVGINVFTQNYKFDAFSSDIFADRVVDGVITYEIENTTSKDLEITIQFLDDNDNVTDTEVFIIQQAPSVTIQRQIAYGDSGRSIDIIKTLSTIRVTAQNLGDNTSVSNLPNPLVVLKSSGMFRVRLQ